MSYTCFFFFRRWLKYAECLHAFDAADDDDDDDLSPAVFYSKVPFF